MTLEITLQNAISGLQTSKQSLQVISNNIANANVEGYSRKTIEQTSRVISGTGFGVELALTSRNVDEGVLKQLRKETGELERLTLREQFFSQVNAFFGKPEDNNSVAHLTAELASTLDSLGTTPETAATQFTTVKTAIDLADELDRLSVEVQRLRGETNGQITTAITTFNSAMDTVVKTNSDIIQFNASKISIAELEDQRDKALNVMSEIMDITSFSRSDQSIAVFTGGGQTLVDGTKQAVSYNQPSAMNAVLEYVPTSAANFVSPTASSGYPAGSIPGIFVGTALTQSDITSKLDSGKLKSLVDMRDVDLPAIQAQLDELAEKLKEELNKVHNQGVGFPAAASLTGDRFLTTGTDISASTGLVRIAVVDQSGSVVESNVLDLSNAAYTDVSTLLTNGTTIGINDLFTNIAATVNTSGRLVLTASGNGNRIAINELTSSMSAASDVSRGFSDFFGLNNLYSSTENFSRYRTDSQASATSSVVVTGGTLAFTGSFGSSTVTVTAGDTLTSLATTINADATLTTAGITAQVISDGTVFRLEISDSAGDEFAMTGGGSLFADSGLRTDNRGISSRLAVRTDIQNDSFLISRGELQSSKFESYPFASDTAAINASGGAQTLTFTDSGLSVSVAYNETTDTLQTLATSINNDATLIAQNISAEVVADGGFFKLAITDGDGGNFHVADSGTALARNLFVSNAFSSATTAVGTGTSSETLTIGGVGITAQTFTYTPSTDTLTTLQTAIAANGTLTGAGITAAVITDGTTSRLSITDATGTEIVTFNDTGDNLRVRDTGISVGDGSVADRMAAVFEATLSFQAAPQGGGGLAQTSTTLATFGANILSFNSAQLSATNTDLQFQESLQLELFNKNASISGVNIDEELSNMIIFEQAYLAAARVISVTQELFRALQEIV